MGQKTVKLLIDDSILYDVEKSSHDLNFLNDEQETIKSLVDDVIKNLPFDLLQIVRLYAKELKIEENSKTI